jgi:AraC-like DNA-binding protein
MNQMGCAKTSVAVIESSAVARAPGRVSENILRALAEVVQQRGVSLDELLGQSAASFSADPATLVLSLARLDALFARAVELTREPALGLHCGLQASEASFGLMSPLIAHAPTLRHGLTLLMQFHQLLLEEVHVRMSERTGEVELRLEFTHDPGRALVEFTIAGLTRCLRAFGSNRRDIRAVCFRHVRPAYYHAYAATFSGAECFQHAFTGIVFSADALDRPHLHRESELHKLVLAEAETKLKRLWRPLSWTEQLRTLMNNRAPAEISGMDAAARALGLSERSLRRKLAEEGTSFRNLRQSVLLDSARSMLRNPALSLQSIAHMLGFSDAAAFGRAFRRWDSCSPAAFRASFFEQAHSAPERDAALTC